MALSTLQTTGILVGIIYYIMTLNNTRKNQQLTLETRRTQAFLTIVNNILSKEGIEHSKIIRSTNFANYEEWREKREKNPEYNTAYFWYIQLLECTGILLKEEILDINIIAQWNPGFTLQFWEQYKDVIHEHRKRTNNNMYFSKLEYLCNQLQEYYENHPET